MDRKKYEEDLKKWHGLIKQAKNFSEGKADFETEEVFEITVAEVLGVGHYIMMPPEVSVVRDTEGRVWLIPETQGEDSNLNGLVSLHNVGPGMKLRLRIKKIFFYETKTFPLTPESRADRSLKRFGGV